ncbi:MAG: histone deacetylase [Alkalispirochaetaceae bacterium]
MVPVVFHPGYVVPLPEGHRFPMPKFAMIHEILLSEGITSEDASIVPESAPREVVELVHTREYVSALLEGTLSPGEERRIGLPWSEALIGRTFRAVGGTIETARLALRHGLACNSAGGTHHAHPDFGSGFCLLNDLAVAARCLLEEGSVSRILLVDLDVHQGDGTARALEAYPDLVTFSMHCESNFPFRKQRSDYDLPLSDGLGDQEYLDLLAETLPELTRRHKPDLILYDAGVDVFAGDRLGRLDLTLEGIRRRDRYVIDHALASAIPIATVIGGGYDRDLWALSDRHAIVHRAAATAADSRSL